MAAKQNDLLRTHHFRDDLSNALDLELFVFRKMGKGRFSMSVDLVETA